MIGLEDLDMFLEYNHTLTLSCYRNVLRSIQHLYCKEVFEVARCQDLRNLRRHHQVYRYQVHPHPNDQASN